MERSLPRPEQTADARHSPRLPRLGLGDLRLILALWPLVERRDPLHRGSGAPKVAARDDAHGGGALAWASLYELPFPKHLAAAAVAFDMDRELIRAASSAIPIASLAELSATFEKRDFDQGASVAELAAGEAWLQAGYLRSIRESLRAMMIFGRPLNRMIELARGRGGDRHLFEAIRLDPTVLGGATGAARHARAVLERDTRWIRAAQRAFVGGLDTRNQARERAAMRLLRALIAQDGARLGERELARLYRALRGTPDPT